MIVRYGEKTDLKSGGQVLGFLSRSKRLASFP